MASILRAAREPVYGLLVVIVSVKQSTVPVPWVLLSSITSSDQVAFVAFLSPRPFSSPRLSCGANTPTNGAPRDGVAIEIGFWLSNTVSPPVQPGKPFP